MLFQKLPAATAADTAGFIGPSWQKDVSDPPSDFEAIHREAMMDTMNMDTVREFLCRIF